MLAGNETLLMVFIAITAVGVLLQGGVLLALLFGARQTERKVMEKIDEIRDDIAPLLSTTRELMEESGPKLHAIVDNVHATTAYVRTQVGSTTDTISEITGRTRHQVRRVDGMVTEVLDTVAHGTRVVQESVLAPLRQVGGWLYAARSILDTMRRPERKPRSRDDMYI